MTSACSRELNLAMTAAAQKFLPALHPKHALRAAALSPPLPCHRVRFTPHLLSGAACLQHFAIVSHFTTVHRLGANECITPSTHSIRGAARTMG